MDVSPAQPLAEFIAAVSAAKTEAAAARAVVEHAAEALDADVAAIVCNGDVVAAVGYAEGRAPVAELQRVRPGAGEALLVVPGAGACPATAATLDHPPGGTLVLARQGPDGFSPEETGTIRGIAQVAATTMRVLCVLDDERAARRELAQLAREQAALRRVATLVAHGVGPAPVFAAVAQEAAMVVPAVDFALVCRYDPDATVEVVGAWSRTGPHELVGIRTPLGGRNVSSLVFEHGRPGRVDHLGDDASALTDTARELGMRSSAGAPISVEGRLWGVMIVASSHENSLPAGAEHRLAGFTELVATAIANAQAREELSTLAGEQAALHRVATLVARGDPPSTVFSAVADEIGRLLPADLVLIRRYGADRTATGVAGWSRTDGPVPLRVVSLSGRNVTARVFASGRPERIDSYEEASGPAAEEARALGVSSAVGVPIGVGGRLWGVTLVGKREHPLAANTEARLAGFTELLATAIANAHARQELRDHAEEQAALRRIATLVAAGAPPEQVFAMVTEEVGQMLQADLTIMIRYESGERLTAVGRWSATESRRQGDRGVLGGHNVTTLVFRTGRPARIDDYADASGAAAEFARADRLCSGVGVPIRVEGRLWGVMVVGSAKKERLPADTEARLAGFTELVATAIANAEAQAALTASRARIVATTDAARRRIERDLHDGAQQRIVSLALQLRTACAAVPSGAEELATKLDDIANGLGDVLDELREIASGIHPATLADGGLPQALKTLARRSAVPVDLDIRLDERLPEPVELAAYYIAAEALTNAAKHGEASVVVLRVAADKAALRIRVVDDGRGGADVSRGSGLLGLKDRVEALDGRISVQSPPGGGTTVDVTLPLDDRRVPPAAL